MMDIKSLVRPHLLTLKPYRSARDEYWLSKGIFLDANENPYGSITGEAGHNRYPDPNQRQLKAKISQENMIPEESIFLGNGSDEAIDLLIRAFCEPTKDHILIFPPTYGMYQVSGDIHNVEVDRVLLNNSFQLDMKRVLSAIQRQPKIIFLCSPNNPTGNLFSKTDIYLILKSTRGLVVIDEAYIDFSEDQSWIEALNDYPNLVLLRTFSKSWGMASLRLGKCFANPEIITIINKIKPPYNIPGPVQALAYKALSNKKQKNGWVREINVQREWLRSRLSGFSSVITVYESDCNFLLVKFEKSKMIFEKLISNHIIVRDRGSQPLCADCLRITIGTKQENERLLQVLESIK